MKTKKIVGVALILFCVILLFVYTFGFLIGPKAGSSQVAAKKEDISNNSAVLDVGTGSQTSSSSGNQVSTASPQVVQPISTIRNTNRRTSAS